MHSPALSARKGSPRGLGSAARAREELRAGLTELAGAVGLALVQVRPAGARAGLGAELRILPPLGAEARRRRGRGSRGRRGGARPVGVGGTGGGLGGARGRPRGREAQGPGARAPRGVLQRGHAARRRTVLGLREARARRAGGRARGLPEAGPVLGGRLGLPAPQVGPGAGSGLGCARPPRSLGDRLRPGPRRLRTRAAAGVGLPVVGRRGCRERRGEAGEAVRVGEAGEAERRGEGWGKGRLRGEGRGRGWGEWERQRREGREAERRGGEGRPGRLREEGRRVEMRLWRGGEADRGEEEMALGGERRWGTM